MYANQYHSVSPSGENYMSVWLACYSALLAYTLTFRKKK